MAAREESLQAVAAAELSENVETMVAMGYPKDKCENALRRCRNNIQYAVDYIALTEGQRSTTPGPIVSGSVVPRQQQFIMEDDDDSEDEDTWPAPSEQLGSQVQSLIEMGFTKEQAETALQRTEGDFDLALSMLLSQNSS